MECKKVLSTAQGFRLFSWVFYQAAAVRIGISRRPAWYGGSSVANPTPIPDPVTPKEEAKAHWGPKLKNFWGDPLDGGWRAHGNFEWSNMPGMALTLN